MLPTTKAEWFTLGRPFALPNDEEESGDATNATIDWSDPVSELQILNDTGDELTYVVTCAGPNSGKSWSIPDGRDDRFVAGGITRVAITVGGGATGKWYLRAFR